MKMAATTTVNFFPSKKVSHNHRLLFHHTTQNRSTSNVEKGRKNEAFGEAKISLQQIRLRRQLVSKSITQMHSPVDSSSSAPKLVLYSYWQSSCSWRVSFALNLKGLRYEYRAVNLVKGEQFTPEFERLNPLHYVPVLVDGDVIVSDSYAILLYLEEKYPRNPLLPADPLLRAINLQAASIVSSSIQPLVMMSLVKYLEDKFGLEERVAWVQFHIENGFQALEKLLKDCAGTYSTGERVYMADVFLAPQIATTAKRFNVDMSKFPTLHAIYESCKALPEFQASSPDRQPDAVP